MIRNRIGGNTKPEKISGSRDGDIPYSPHFTMRARNQLLDMLLSPTEN